MEDSFAKVGVISVQFCQVPKNGFLPILRDEDVVSQPLKTRKINIYHIQVVRKFCLFC